MGEIKDFNCTYDNSAGISGAVTEGLGLTFPDAYLHADTMAKLSKALKEYDGAGFCELPFCHTVAVSYTHLYLQNINISPLPLVYLVFGPLTYT